MSFFHILLSFQSLAYAKLHAFESGHGWFFWNFKTELEVRVVVLFLYYLNCVHILGTKCLTRVGGQTHLVILTLELIPHFGNELHGFSVGGEVHLILEIHPHQGERKTLA